MFFCIFWLECPHFVDMWSASGGHTGNSSNSLCKVSLAIRGAKFGWVVSVFFTGRWQPLPGETLAANRNATTLFLFFGGGLLVQVKVISRLRSLDGEGNLKIHKIPPPRNSATAKHQQIQQQQNKYNNITTEQQVQQ